MQYSIHVDSMRPCPVGAHTLTVVYTTSEKESKSSQFQYQKLDLVKAFHAEFYLPLLDAEVS